MDVKLDDEVLGYMIENFNMQYLQYYDLQKNKSKIDLDIY
jgi:hypothetical protein